jgi:hypothetical protein
MDNDKAGTARNHAPPPLSCPSDMKLLINDTLHAIAPPWHA